MKRKKTESRKKSLFFDILAVVIYIWVVLLAYILQHYEKAV